MPYIMMFLSILLGSALVLLAIKIGRTKTDDTSKRMTIADFKEQLPIESPDLLAGPFLEAYHGLDLGAQNELKREIRKYGWEAHFLTDLHSQNRAKKLAALEVLGFIGGEKSFWPLMNALASKDEEISFSGTAALKELEAPHLVESLVMALREPQKWPPARVAEILLPKGGEIVPILMGELTKGNEQSKKLIKELLEEMEIETTELQRGGSSIPPFAPL